MLDAVCAVGCVPLRFFSSLVSVRSRGGVNHVSLNVYKCSPFCTDIKLSGYAILQRKVHPKPSNIKRQREAVLPPISRDF